MRNEILVVLVALQSAFGLGQELAPRPFYIRTAGFLDSGLVDWNGSAEFASEHREGLKLIKQGRYQEAATLLYAHTREHRSNLISHLGYLTATVGRGAGSLASMVDALEVRSRSAGRQDNRSQLIQDITFAAALVELTHMHPYGGSRALTREVSSPYLARIEELLRGVTSAAAGDRYATLWLSNIRHRMGREDLRRAALVEHLRLEPRDHLVRHHLAKCYQGGVVGMPIMPPNTRPEIRERFEAEARHSQLRMDLSFEEATRIIRERPQFGPAYYLAGSSSFHLKQLARAGEFLRTYLRLEPKGLRAGDARRYLKEIDGK